MSNRQFLTNNENQQPHYDLSRYKESTEVIQLTSGIYINLLFLENYFEEPMLSPEQ